MKKKNTQEDRQGSNCDICTLILCAIFRHTVRLDIQVCISNEKMLYLLFSCFLKSGGEIFVLLLKNHYLCFFSVEQNNKV